MLSFLSDVRKCNFKWLCIIHLFDILDIHCKKSYTGVKLFHWNIKKPKMSYLKIKYKTRKFNFFQSIMTLKNIALKINLITGKCNFFNRFWNLTFLTEFASVSSRADAFAILTIAAIVTISHLAFVVPAINNIELIINVKTFLLGYIKLT